MKKLTTLIVLSALMTATPAFAQTSNDQAIKSDVQSINKTNAEISNDKAALAHDRAAVATDKANGSYGKEAADNMKIGAEKGSIAAKGVQKSADEKMLEHHKKNVVSDSTN